MPTEGTMPTEGFGLAQELARIADLKKGEEIRILNLEGRHSLIDLFVIVTANNERHAQIIGEEAVRYAKQHQIRPRHLEVSADWVCGDFGDVVLHVFTESSRQFYDLENLWGDAARLDWQAA